MGATAMVTRTPGGGGGVCVVGGGVPVPLLLLVREGRVGDHYGVRTLVPWIVGVGVSGGVAGCLAFGGNRSE